MNDMVKMRDVVLAYDAETSVDQTIPIKRRYDALANFVVTPENVDDAKDVRTKLNALAKDASAPRMRVQRAIKAHPIGKFAFTKSQLERDIEATSDAMKRAIDALTSDAKTLALREDPQTWVCFITAPLSAVNKLAVECNERGMAFENRGPAAAE